MIKSLLNISDLTSTQLISLIQEQDYFPILKDKNIGMIFEKYSTRTRVSFSVGISQLGGTPLELRFEELNFSNEESFEDTFLALNCYLDGLIYRTSKHIRLIEASKYFKKPIINALSDQSHPCQTISDLFTLNQNFRTLNLKILWMGDMNNVCFSLVEALKMISDLDLIICTPKIISEKKNWKLTNNIQVINKLQDVDLRQINCVMTDVFISMNDKDDINKTKLLRNYAVTEEIMSNTSNESVFMHCLPAKIGMEVDKKVFNSSKSIVWKQAFNRMIAQKNLLQFIDWN